MTDKAELIKQLPGYLSHEFNGERWFVEFVPSGELAGSGAVINDAYFDDDYSREKRLRTLLMAQREVATTESNELAYIAGNRAAYTDMLRACLKALGYDDPLSQQAAWVLEREAAITQLRAVCAEHGDNDWSDDLNLADVVEKHLGVYLA